MKINNNLKLTMLLALIVGFTSCKKDDGGTPAVTVKNSMTYDYEFNNGQVVPTAAYSGSHSDELSAKLMVEELSNGKTRITVNIMNAVDGEMYHIHAHDGADPATTPNGTPYNESPNADLFTQHAMAMNGMATATQTTDMSYTDITTTYAGFFVIHDPLQAVSTVDISTYVVVGGFAREQGASGLMSKTFDYAFNTGQVAPSYAYSGTHETNLSAKLKVQELGNGESRVTVWVMNSKNGEKYMIHSHDAADPTTTPNMTPYNETPNSAVCTLMAMGNGSTVSGTQISTMSYTDLTTTYSGFFVIHDPLQAIDTTDPTTYVVLGSFAR